MGLAVRRFLAQVLAAGFSLWTGVASASDLGKLDETYWRVESLPGRAPVAPSVVVTLNGDEGAYGRISYSSDCYFTGGAWTQKADGLHFAFGSSTMGSCRPREGSESEGFERALAEARTFSVAGGRLTFKAPNGTPVMVLQRFDPTGLEYRQWRISSYFDGAAMAIPDSDVPDFYSSDRTAMIAWPWPAITFSGGRLMGSPGCGGLDGGYKLSGDHVRITAGYDLAGFCMHDQFILADLVDKALTGERRVVHDGGKMLLKDNKGQVQIVLEPVQPSTLDSGRWRIIRYRNGAALETPVRKEQQWRSGGLSWNARVAPWIAFSGGRMEAPGYCPAIEGDYHLSEGHLTILPDIQILSGVCFDAGISREGGLLYAALANSRRIERVGGDVILLRDDKGLIQIELAR
jgi:heat shock protein HslJ